MGRNELWVRRVSGMRGQGEWVKEQGFGEALWGFYDSCYVSILYA